MQLFLRGLRALTALPKDNLQRKILPLPVYYGPMQTHPNIPLVLAIGGHDPSGGAGLQADIETIAVHGCHALTVVTALTTQNSCAVSAIHTQPPMQIIEQCQLLLDESQVAAIKIGLLGQAATARALAELLSEYPDIPVVLDPVLASGNGEPLVDAALQQEIRDRLSPHCTLLTPNAPEARALTGQNDLAQSASTLIAKGCGAVLITGTHETGERVINRLYGLAGILQTHEWQRLPGSYHGSGCTLAAAVTAGLAGGLQLAEAVTRAQEFTWNSLNHALSTGRCQRTPNRFYAGTARG